MREKKPILIIAEAGVNHNGSEEVALELIDAAVDAGADIVKFQTFRAERLAAKGASKAAYQVESSRINETQFEMLRRLELSPDSHFKLEKHCRRQGIEFLSTAFDIESLSFLIDNFDFQRVKIPSGEITNAPLLLAYARSGRDLILSTGMATLSEIEQALSVIAFGLVGWQEKESMKAFKQAYISQEGQLAIRNSVTLLHCTTEYPAPFKDINLLAMQSLSQTFLLPTGYSDHSQGIAVPIAAAACGAAVIEKHFTLSRGMDGPDHASSLEPSELKAMITSIRQVELAMGDGLKIPRGTEFKNMEVARKCLVATSGIKKGEKFSCENIGIKRAGDGISPMQYWSFLGKLASEDFNIGEMICE